MHLLVGCLMLIGLSTLGGCNGARDTALDLGETPNHRGFIHRTITNEGRTRQYMVFLPLNYSPDHKYPAIMFLHGIGEAGSDLHGPMRVGLAPFAADRAANFPFIVIIPQSTGGWNPDSDDAKDAIAALLQAERDFAIDPDRVALTGLSTGGYGTFAIGAKYSHLFAALVPMCPSGGDSVDGEILAKMNIWAFENAADPFVMPASMATTLGSISSAGGTYKHTVYGAFGHDCWERAYSEGELFDWLLQQRRPSAAGKPGATPVQPAAAAPPARSSSSAVPVRGSSTPVVPANGGQAWAPATPY